ncbi:unnamed protein product [Candida verbasci]|uniref:Glutamine amidotransferase domain-containing protein n=1 Tax=Candida verbasci TaxID=1227364 RepID=A0A9W4TT71_9ASCO|nr:unnamed protein product [Candida verbasci]
MTEDKETIPHIAILVLDDEIPNITSKYGDFGDNTINFLSKASNQLPPTVKYQLKSENSEFLNGQYSKLNLNLQNNYIIGFILTGSRSDSFRSDIEWINRLNNFITEQLVPSNLPSIGLCFGHQILCKNLGCKIDRNDKGWELGTATINLNTEIFKISNSPFLELKLDNEELLNHLNLIEFHRDIVYGLPNALTDDDKYLNIGSTSNCAIQGIIGGNILTFQGHPEFETDYSLDLLKSKFDAGVIELKEYEKAKYHTETLNNQGVLIGKVILKFIEDNRQ